MRRLRTAALALAGWTLVALFFASQTYVIYYNRPAAERAPFELFFLAALIDWWGWMLLSPLVIWLARRLPFVGAGWPRRVALHLVLALLLAAAKVVINGLLRMGLLDYPMQIPLRDLHTGVVTYGLIAGGATAVELYRRWRERELSASRLAARLAEARLAALSAQLQPHFLFNTLAAIQSLLHDDPETADRMISHLGDLLRARLRAADAQEVPLSQELDMLAPYLEIQRARHAERLAVKIDVPDELRGTRVPTLLLQPLVENAIRHGLAPRAAPGHLEIVAARENGALVLEVRDDGIGAGGAPEEGVGLRNTRLRLAELYGARGHLVLAPRDGGGTVARVSLPA